MRLGAMGDILHAFPAAESLRLSFPEARISWVTRPRWTPLLAGATFVDDVIVFEGARSWTRLRSIRPELAFDFQGLLQSAVVGRIARPHRFWGFDRPIVRESLATLLYTDRLAARGPHRIQRNLQLVAAAGAKRLTDTSWVPSGNPEGELPKEPFVLASPFAGWAGKQWPLESYAALANILAGAGVTLVLNVAPERAPRIPESSGIWVHVSGLPGLIHATGRAAAVLGVDSGPLHLAAAMRKPGVAIFGPTDPGATGPYGGSIRILRASDTETTYDRHREIHSSMRCIAPSEVALALREAMAAVLRLR